GVVTSIVPAPSNQNGVSPCIKSRKPLSSSKFSCDPGVTSSQRFNTLVSLRLNSAAFVSSFLYVVASVSTGNTWVGELITVYISFVLRLQIAMTTQAHPPV